MTSLNKFWELENNYLKNWSISDPSDDPNLYYVNINETINSKIVVFEIWFNFCRFLTGYDTVIPLPDKMSDQ
jgi:hypothetical protein